MTIFFSFHSSSPPTAESPENFLNSNRKTHSPSNLQPMSADSVVTLLDYGGGNGRSLRNGIRFLGHDIKNVEKPEDILNADRLIFPGGGFTAAMNFLNQNGMAEALRRYIESDQPFLGICLGFQILFDSLEEEGTAQGLGLIPGVVGRFDSSHDYKVPHIGWHALKIKNDSEILDDVGGKHVYFVHSYRAMPSEANKEWISSTCNYGEDFIASIKRGNVHAVLFHPEKSGDVGLSILKRFLHSNSSLARRPIQRDTTSELAKRVIACLDVRTDDKGDLVVAKGDQYDVREHTKENEVRNLFNPVELARQYYVDGADEISFSNKTEFGDMPLGDSLMLKVLRLTSENVFVPLTVGGGITDFTDSNGRHYTMLEVASEYFKSGADKISIGSDAVYAAEEYIITGVKTGNSSLEQISCAYGNLAVVVSIDTRRIYLKNPEEVEFKAVKVTNPGPIGEEYAWYQCTVSGEREGRPICAFELAKAVEELGAGEILLNCIDCDGQGKWFDRDLIKLISDAVSIPVIASVGEGKPEHFSEVFMKTIASAAGIFHKEAVKEHLSKEGIKVRKNVIASLTQILQPLM